MGAATLLITQERNEDAPDKIDQTGEAEKVVEKYTEDDSTTVYFFGKAAVAFQKGDEEVANDWIRKAKQANNLPQANTIFEDSHFEAGWLQ